MPENERASERWWWWWWWGRNRFDSNWLRIGIGSIALHYIRFIRMLCGMCVGEVNHLISFDLKSLGVRKAVSILADRSKWSNKCILQCPHTHTWHLPTWETEILWKLCHNQMRTHTPRTQSTPQAICHKRKSHEIIETPASDANCTVTTPSFLFIFHFSFVSMDLKSVQSVSHVHMRAPNVRIKLD